MGFDPNQAKRIHPMKHVLLSILVFTIIGMSSQAEARVPIAPYWIATLPSGTLEDVPLPGTLAIDAQFFASFGGYCYLTVHDGVAAVSVTVSDTSGTNVAGTLAYRDALARLIWTPDDQTAMAPGSTYTVNVLFDNDSFLSSCGGITGANNIEGTFTVIMGSEMLPAVEPPVITDLQLTEVAAPNVTVCCDIELGTLSCSGSANCEPLCWPDSYTYRPYLTMTLGGPAGLREDFQSYEVHRVDESGNEEDLAGSYPDPASIGVSFDDVRARYCVQVRAVSGVVPNDYTESEVVCKDASELVAISRTAPETPDLSDCVEDSLPPGYTLQGRVQAEDCSCRVLGTRAPSRSPFVPLLLGAMVLGGTGLGRRR